MSKKVTNIVFAGGPGGGKSTSIDDTKFELEALGFLVIVLPETATEVMNEGILPGNYEPYEFQKIMFSRQLEKETKARELAAKSNRPVVIIHDRSLIDNKAYLSRKDWNKLLKEFNFTEQEVMNRYDLVINLTSTAVDKPEIYNQIKANNDKRQEDAPEAAKKDQLTLAGYARHHNLRVVGNQTDFPEKIRRVIECILVSLNIPFHFNSQFKYLVNLAASDIERLNSISDKIYIEQTYLKAPEGLDIKVRKTIIDGEVAYYFINKRKDGASEEIIDNAPITESQYLEYLTEQDRALASK